MGLVRTRIDVSNCNRLAWYLGKDLQERLGDRNEHVLQFIEDHNGVEAPRGAFDSAGCSIPVQY